MDLEFQIKKQQCINISFIAIQSTIFQLINENTDYQLCFNDCKLIA